MKPTPTPEPRTLREFLDREEARTLHELHQSASALGDDLKRIGHLEERVQRHPWLALGAAAAIGFAVAPLVSRFAGRGAALAMRLLRHKPALKSALTGLALDFTHSNRAKTRA